MRSLLAFTLFLTAGLAGFTQTPAAVPAQEFPKDPRELLAAAAPFYDFSDSALKPFHLKANYQLYDNKGKPSEQGTFEYWQLSRNVYRRTWKGAGWSYTDWHLVDGELAYEESGRPLNLFEYRLHALLLRPFPASKDINPEHFRVVDETTSDQSGPCVTVVPITGGATKPEQVQEGPFPTYCFNQSGTTLLSAFSYERVFTRFGMAMDWQGKHLTRQIEVAEGQRKMLSATVSEIDSINPGDLAIVPDPTAIRTRLSLPRDSKIIFANAFSLKAEVMNGLLIKKVNPVYPREAKKRHIEGTVDLDAIIGTDGRIHDLRVTSAPSALLAASAFSAVWQWQYKPYELQGEKVAVDTTVHVIYTLGR